MVSALFFAIKGMSFFIIIFRGLIYLFYFNLFLCHSNILSFSKLILFLVVSEIECKFGNNKGYGQGEIFLEIILF